MQQTLMTLGALMIITMVSVNQQRANYIAVEGIYVREQESAALDYASLRLENIENSYAYDEATTDGSEPDLGTMSDGNSFGPDTGENNEADFDDVDDYHNFTESISHAISTDTFRFDVTYSLRYINPAAPSQQTASPTMAKELTVAVVSQDTIGFRVAKYTGTKIILAADIQ
ncbi:MAG: hypothetical protein AAF564_01350 [Bacteroidota bacterium]